MTINYGLFFFFGAEIKKKINLEFIPHFKCKGKELIMREEDRPEEVKPS